MAPWPPEGGRVKDPNNQLWILPSVKNITSMQLECVAKLNQEGPRLTLDWILHSEKLYGETCSFSHAKMCYTELYRVDTASLFSLLLYLICPSPSCSSLSPHLTKSAMSYLVLEDIHSFHYFLRQPENSFISTLRSFTLHFDENCFFWLRIKCFFWRSIKPIIIYVTEVNLKKRSTFQSWASIKTGSHFLVSSDTE